MAGIGAVAVVVGVVGARAEVDRLVALPPFMVSWLPRTSV